MQANKQNLPPDKASPPRRAALPNILVVDDVPENLKLLIAILGSQGYVVRPVSSGPLALDAARNTRPDLILMDIIMPEMNGYAVCDCMKADQALAGVPVIFLTALGECSDKVQAFRHGGVDFITKPFQPEEVLARVEVHLELQRLRTELKNQNVRLEEKVLQRTQELAMARNRLSILDQAKSDLLSLVSHELRMPLNGAFGIADLIFEGCTLTPPQKELLRLYHDSQKRILSILDDALLLTQIGLHATQFQPASVALGEVLAEAVGQLKQLNRPAQAAFGRPPIFSGPVAGDAKMLLKALEALLDSARRFGKPGTLVEFQEGRCDNMILLEIRSSGHAIPPEFLGRIFDVMAIPEALVPGGDLGLKFPLAERIISLMGGSVSIENCAAPGIRIKVRLKRFSELETDTPGE